MCRLPAKQEHKVTHGVVQCVWQPFSKCGSPSRIVYGCLLGHCVCVQMVEGLLLYNVKHAHKRWINERRRELEDNTHVGVLHTHHRFSVALQSWS